MVFDNNDGRVAQKGVVWPTGNCRETRMLTKRPLQPQNKGRQKSPQPRNAKIQNMLPFVFFPPPKKCETSRLSCQKHNRPYKFGSTELFVHPTRIYKNGFILKTEKSPDLDCTDIRSSKRSYSKKLQRNCQPPSHLRQTCHLSLAYERVETLSSVTIFSCRTCLSGL